jgi:hypothetical protein
LPLSCLESPPAKAGLLLKSETWSALLSLSLDQYHWAQILCSRLQGIMLAFGIIILGKSRTPRLTLILRSPTQEIDQPTHSFSYFYKQLALIHIFGDKMRR